MKGFKYSKIDDLEHGMARVRIMNNSDVIEVVQMTPAMYDDGASIDAQSVTVYISPAQALEFAKTLLDAASVIDVRHKTQLAVELGEWLKMKQVRGK